MKAKHEMAAISNRAFFIISFHTVKVSDDACFYRVLNDHSAYIRVD